MRSLPDRIIVIGDLHLGEGAAPVRGTVSGEHFFRDRAFQTWLDRLTRRATRRGRRLELALNGDAFDFLRVLRLPETLREVAAWRRLLVAVRVPHDPAELRRIAQGRFTRRERLFGLGTDEPACVWKLSVIAAAHPVVFRALARFGSAGHCVTVIRGNHDPEWAWEGVQRAFQILLRRARGRGRGRRRGEGQRPSSTVRFRSRMYRRANVHIEHGHRADWLTFTERDFTGRKRARLRLPFGSLISRYVLNVLERRVPPRGSVPPSRRLLEVVQQRLWRMVPAIAANALRAIPLIGIAGWTPWFRRLLRWWPARVSMTMSTALLMLMPLAPLVGTRLPGHGNAGVLAASLLGLGLPIAGFMTRQLTAQFHPENVITKVRRYARRVAVTLPAPAGRRYVVLGHSHRPEQCEWTGERSAVVYLNPGAWVDGAADEDGPRFVWLARRGAAYVRHRLLSLDAVAR